jgi:hypothetical protein
MTLNKIIVDCAKGTQTIVPLTATEIAERDQEAAKYAQEKAKADADAQALQALKDSAKAKLIAGEKLTDKEAAAIVI